MDKPTYTEIPDTSESNYWIITQHEQMDLLPFTGHYVKIIKGYKVKDVLSTG